MSLLRPASVLVLSIVLSVVGTTPAAVAQSGPSTAPPGNSAVDQYRESAPPSSSKQRKLNRRDREALARRGADGAALAAVLERSGGVPQASAPSGSGETAPGGKRTGSDGRSGGGSEARSDTSSGATGPGEGRPRERAGDAADSRPIAPAAASSTVGPIPVWAMLVAAVALVGIGLLVRARATS